MKATRFRHSSLTTE